MARCGRRLRKLDHLRRGHWPTFRPVLTPGAGYGAPTGPLLMTCISIPHEDPKQWRKQLRDCLVAVRCLDTVAVDRFPSLESGEAFAAGLRRRRGTAATCHASRRRSDSRAQVAAAIRARPDRARARIRRSRRSLQGRIVVRAHIWPTCRRVRLEPIPRSVGDSRS